MFGVAFVVGLIANGYLISNARKDVVDVIDNTKYKNETQNFLTEAGKNVKAFGERQVPQVVNFVVSNVTAIGVAMLANYLSSAPIDWGDKPWENEAVKNMVVFVGAQLIAEGLSMIDTCGSGYSGGPMVGKPNKRQLADKLASLQNRACNVNNPPYEHFYTHEQTIAWVEKLRSDLLLINPILEAGGSCEHICRLVKAMGPEILSLAGLAVGLQCTNNNWLAKAQVGAAYVVGSAIVNAIALRAGSSGSVRSSMALQVMKILKDDVFNTQGMAVEMKQV